MLATKSSASVVFGERRNTAVVEVGSSDGEPRRIADISLLKVVGLGVARWYMSFGASALLTATGYFLGIVTPVLFGAISAFPAVWIANYTMPPSSATSGSLGVGRRWQSLVMFDQLLFLAAFGLVIGVCCYLLVHAKTSRASWQRVSLATAAILLSIESVVVFRHLL